MSRFFAWILIGFLQIISEINCPECPDSCCGADILPRLTLWEDVRINHLYFKLYNKVKVEIPKAGGNGFNGIPFAFLLLLIPGFIMIAKKKKLFEQE